MAVVSIKVEYMGVVLGLFFFGLAPILRKTFF